MEPSPRPPQLGEPLQDQVLDLGTAGAQHRRWRGRLVWVWGHLLLQCKIGQCNATEQHPCSTLQSVISYVVVVVVTVVRNNYMPSHPLTYHNSNSMQQAKQQQAVAAASEIAVAVVVIAVVVAVVVGVVVVVVVVVAVVAWWLSADM